MKNSALIFVCLIFLGTISLMADAMPVPTAVYGNIFGSENPNILVTIAAYETQTDKLVDFLQTNARTSDGMYVEAITSDISPNMDILVVAVSSDSLFYGMKKIENITPGNVQNININVIKTTPEVPPPEIKPPSGGGGGGGGSPINKDRKIIPPINTSSEEDWAKYLEEYYNKSQKDYEKERNESLNQQQQEAVKKEQERRFNSSLEYLLYLIVLVVIMAGYSVYRKIRRKKTMEALAGSYYKKRNIR